MSSGKFWRSICQCQQQETATLDCCKIDKRKRAISCRLLEKTHEQAGKWESAIFLSFAHPLGFQEIHS
ncbi:unnamed protein product [Lathyrus oleraceus]